MGFDQVYRVTVFVDSVEHGDEATPKACAGE